MRYIPEFGSRFRILKGGKISLVVSALLVGNLMVGELNAAAPVVTSTPSATNLKLGNSFSYTPTATDADNDALSWSVKSGATKPSWLDVNSNTISEFESVGNQGFSSNANSQYRTLAFDNNGIPYVAFQDGVSPNRLIVMKLNGSTWTSVGDSTGISSGQLYSTASLAFDSSNTPYVTIVDRGYGDRVVVRKWNETSWSVVGGVSNNQPVSASDHQATLSNMKISADGVLYVSYYDNEDKRMYVSKFNEETKAWDTIGNFLIPSSVNGYSVSIYNASFIIGSDNKPFVAYTYGNFGMPMTLLIKKYDGTNWNDIDASSQTGISNFSMDLDSDNKPYIYYTENGNTNDADKKGSVVMYNGTNWVNIGAAKFTVTNIDSFNNTLKLDAFNTPYVSSKDNYYGQSYLMKYNGTTWEKLGDDINNTAFTMELDSSGTPYVAFNDRTTNPINKLSVKKYTSKTTFSLNGTPTTAGTYDVNLTVTDGTNPVNHSFQITAMADVAPTITSTPNTISKRNELYQYVPTATDANGDTLTWSLKSGTTLPNWLTGITTTVAKGVAGNTINGLNFVDGKLATEVKLKVYDTVFDASGNMYVNDGAHIRKIDKATGKIYNFAGMDEGYSTNKPAIAANIRGASGMTFDSAGNFYFADTDAHRIGGETNNVIRKIDTNGLITTIIGDPDSSDYTTYGMGGLATAANLIKPTDLHLNSDGTIYILDAGRSKILKVDTNGIINELQNTTYDIYQPKNMTVDNTGNIYVTTGHAIKKIVPGTGETTIAGTYYDYGNTGDGAVATASRLKNPSDVVIASNGDIYIADTGNNSIRKIDATTGNISTIKTNIYSPAGLYFDRDGNLFVTSGQSTDVRQVSQLYLDTFILQGTPSSFSDVNVSLVVTDGANPVEQTFSFVAGNTAPYNTNGIPSIFNEEQAIGTTVATLTTNDNDSGSGDTFTYSLTCATPAADDGKFEIAGDLLKTKVVLDYETQSTARICVRTTDRGGLFADTLRTINLMNVTETTTGGTTGGTDTNTGGTTDGDTTTGGTDTNTGGTTTPTIPADTTPPTATITLSDSALTAGESSIVTITFSEEVNGVEILDFRVMGGRLTNLVPSTTDAKIYTATFTPAPNLAINTNAITLTNGYKDTAGNQGVATTSPNYTISTYPAIDANKEAVSKALQALVIPTNINWVTSNLTLPSTVTGSTATITWTSSKPTVVGTYGAVTNAGVVTRGSSTDTYVILTATITSGNVVAKKPFTIFVPKAAATSTEQTKTITEKISIADAVGTTQTATAITDDINVSSWATNTPSGFTTTIISDKPTIISNTGDVTRSTTTDEVVTLTIKTVDDADATKYTEKTITVVVKKAVEDTSVAKLAEAKEILSSNIIANDNLNLNDITKNLTLPTTIGGTTIVWTSSNTDVIATNGTVTPTGGDVVVKLTATITVNGETITKDFIVKVPAVGGDVATKLAEAKTTTADLESKADTTTGTTNPTRTSTIGFVTSGGTVEQKVDIKTDIFTSDITTGTSGEVITTIAPRPTTTPNQIQEIKVVQNPNGTSTNNVTIKDSEGNSKTTSLNFTPTNVNQEYKDDGSVEINIIPDVTTTNKKSKITVAPTGTITNSILDDSNTPIVSSTTQIQDASLFVSADGNVTIETVVATTLNNEDTTATVTTTSSSTKVESSTKVGEAEVKSSADVTTGTTLSQNITSGGDVEITATNTAGGRSKKIKTTAQATTTHTVTNGLTETKASFDTAGLNITSNIGTDNITTKVETDQTSPSTTTSLVGNELFEGVVITNDDGTSQTRFRITDITKLESDPTKYRYVDSTVDAATSLPQGTNSTIKLVNGKLVIENKQTTTSKTTLKIGASNDNN